jgi:parallel beta-helix repeat protein
MLTGIKHMKSQRFNLQALHPFSFVAAKRQSGILSVGAMMACAIVLSSPLMALATPATPAPSSTIAQVTPPTPAGAKVIYVNPVTGRDSLDAGNSTQQPLRSITYALKKAAKGTVVQLASGTYTADSGEVFPIVVPTGVILSGDESTKGQNVAIIGGGNYASVTVASQNVTILAYQDSVISGISISNPNVRGTGLWIESTNPHVRNNTFTNSKREGIFVSGTANPVIEDNVFTKNLGNGLTIGDKSKGEIRNNLFDNTGFGIALSETASPEIAQNHIVNNIDGIVVAYESAPVLRNNVIENNKRDGVVAVSNAQPDWGTQDSPGQNRIRNNGRYDVNNSSHSNIWISYGNDISTINWEIQPYVEKNNRASIVAR